MYIRLILTLFSCILLLTGCNGSRDTDEYAYALAIGLDKGDDGNILVSYQIAVPSKLGGGSEGGSGGEKPPFEDVTIKAESLAETRNLAKSIIARTINLTHVKAIIIGEELAKEGIGKAISPLLRFREFRGSIFLLVTNGTAKDFLLTNHPRLEILPSKYLEIMINSSKETGYYLKTPLHDFYLNMKNGMGAPVATLVGVKTLSINDSGNVGSKEKGETTKEYIAGEIPREGLNEVSFAGTAVFHGDKMVLKLTTEETRMLAILRDEFPSGFFVFDDPLVPKNTVNVNMRLGQKPNINIDISDSKPVIKINIFMEGEITAIQSGTFYETDEYRSLLEEQISETIKSQILKTLEKTQSVGADAASLGYNVRSKIITVNELKQLKWSEMYKQADIRLDVKTRLRRTGLMRKTFPIKQ